jgi:nitrogen fixation NifU-like protein
VEVMNPVCGDILRLGARWQADTVEEARFKARGCTACVVCGSVVTEWLHGKRAGEIAALSRDQVDAMAGGLIPESKHAAALAIDAVRVLLNRSGAG